MTDRVLSHLSMAAKAGKVKSGEAAAEQTIRSGKACLLLIAADASENTKKKFRNMAQRYGLPYLIYGSRESVGHAIGREYRSTAAVTDEGLAGLIEDAAKAAQKDVIREE